MVIVNNNKKKDELLYTSYLHIYTHIYMQITDRVEYLHILLIMCSIALD